MPKATARLRDELVGRRGTASDEELLERFVYLFNRAETAEARMFADTSADAFDMLPAYEARIDRTRPLCRPPAPRAKKKRW